MPDNQSEHSKELRYRLMRSLAGVLAAYVLALPFAPAMWALVTRPALAVLRPSPGISTIAPMAVFLTIYVKLPLLAAVFLASPWVLWQVWAFMAPGLRVRGRNLVVMVSAGSSSRAAGLASSRSRWP